MARMIPDNPMADEFNNSYGEKQVYEALRNLPPEYVVFHSIHWQKRKVSGNVVWGESDFTVFHPLRGLIVIEVKSGGIRHDDDGWHQKNTLTSEENRMKDPLVQAEKSKFTFVDLLSEQNDKYHTYWVESAVWFPSVEGPEVLGTLPPGYSQEIVLTKKDLGAVKYSIEKIFDYYGMEVKKYFTDDDKQNVVNMLSPCFNVIPNMSTVASEQEYFFNRMTMEQSYLLDYLEEQRVAAIQGGAGTGKTMLALEKARRVSKNGRVLFLCFNKFLLNTLKEQYGETPNIDFYNLPGLVYAKTGRVDLVDNQDILKYLDNVEPTAFEYEHIIIDEGQDFLEEHIEILSDIAELKGGCFYVFYDKNQLVQQRQSLDWVKSVECRLVLSANCRNTKNIAVTSNKSLGINMVKVRVEIPGMKPCLYINKDFKMVRENLARLIRKYTDQGFSKRDIVILTVKTEENSVLTGVSSVGTYGLSSEFTAGKILFTSARKFKGLEAKIVILVDVDEKTFQSEEERRVFYVGASRAKHYLDMFASVDEAKIVQIATLIGDGNIKNPKAAIGSGLKVRIASDVS